MQRNRVFLKWMLCGILVAVCMVFAPSSLAQSEPPEAVQTDRFGLEEPTGLARAELAFIQTIHGIFLGAQTCALFECDGLRVVLSSLLLGGGAGLGGALWGTQDGITPGRALLMNSATSWGFWDGLALNFILDNWNNEKLSIGTLMAGQLAGLGAGAWLGERFRPNAGDVSLITTSGVWSGVLTVLALNTLDLDFDEQAFFGLLLATTNLGGAGGAYLAQTYPSSRGRSYVISAGGILGALLGAAVPVLIGGEDISDRLLSGSALVGTLAGLGLSVYLTRDWTLAPAQDEATATTDVELISMRWAF